MERLVSEAFANIIKEIPNQDLDVDNTYKVFEKYVPLMVEQYHIVYFSAIMAEPISGGLTQQIKKDITMIPNDNVKAEDIKEFIFEMGNGGYCKVQIAVRDKEDWNRDTEEDIFILARTFFLLIGRARMMHDLHRLSFSDSLTGIANKTQLVRFVINLIVEGSFFGYCANFFNIKNMKLLNNRFSDRGGDQLLIKYTHAIQDFIGDECCIGRLGGDNFCVFIQAEREEEFLEFMRHLHVVLEMPGTDRKAEVKIDTRLGYYYIQPGDSFEKAMDCSSIAMSFSKQPNYSDVMKFEPWMKTQMIQMKELEENIPTAIANEEFVLYYQPKADIRDPEDFKLCGAEALVRWKHDGQMISPGDFIPILEKNGMVTLVDFYVLEHVCKDIKRWQSEGLKPVRISSNFSRRHLRDKYFADKVEAIFQKYEIDPSLLEIEITESYDVEDLEALTKFEKRMHGLGINLSVDDFGSGFSSLKVIKNISADVIKLDKSLIDGVGENKEDQVIVSHLIKMIQSLGKEIIAEGVEQKAQVDFLRANNCNNIQGYLYAKPMPVNQFENYISRED